MAKKQISRDDLVFGRTVLLATDSLRLSAEGAFWIRYHREDRWRYFLVTSLFESMGPREIYLRLNRALARKLSEQETRSFEMFMASPNEALVRGLPKSLQTPPYASEPFPVTVEIADRKADLWVYRLAAGMDRDDLKKIERQFKKEVKDLLAA